VPLPGAIAVPRIVPLSSTLFDALTLGNALTVGRPDAGGERVDVTEDKLEREAPALPVEAAEELSTALPTQLWEAIAVDEPETEIRTVGVSSNEARAVAVGVTDDDGALEGRATGEDATDAEASADEGTVAEKG